MLGPHRVAARRRPPRPRVERPALQRLLARPSGRRHRRAGSLDRDVPEFGRTLGEELLTPTRVYTSDLLDSRGSACRVHSTSMRSATSPAVDSPPTSPGSSRRGCTPGSTGRPGPRRRSSRSSARSGGSRPPTSSAPSTWASASSRSFPAASIDAAMAHLAGRGIDAWVIGEVLHRRRPTRRGRCGGRPRRQGRRRRVGPARRTPPPLTGGMSLSVRGRPSARAHRRTQVRHRKTGPRPPGTAGLGQSARGIGRAQRCPEAHRPSSSSSSQSRRSVARSARLVVGVEFPLKRAEVGVGAVVLQLACDLGLLGFGSAAPHGVTPSCVCRGGIA